MLKDVTILLLPLGLFNKKGKGVQVFSVGNNLFGINEDTCRFNLGRRSWLGASRGSLHWFVGITLYAVAEQNDQVPTCPSKSCH